MLDYDELKRREHIKEEIRRQHLQWMDVMGKQVDENFARHVARVKEERSPSRRT